MDREKEEKIIGEPDEEERNLTGTQSRYEVL